MKISKFTFAAVCVMLTATLFSQNNLGLLFSLQQLPDDSWGVFLMPEAELSPSDRTMAGTGQVTLVAPDIFEYCDFRNYGGTWGENARVDNPEEALGRSYISFGFLSDNPKMQLVPKQGTLLFSFMTDDMFTGTLSLIDNNNDPFNAPNSCSSNPGNDICVADFGQNKIHYYLYNGNYYQEQGTRPVFAKQLQNGDKTKVEGMVIQWLEDGGEQEK